MVRRVLVSFVLVLLFSAVSHALDFSADMIYTAKGTKTEGKMFFTKDKIRMDMSTPEKVSTITREDKKVVWSILHKQKMYMETPIQHSTQKPMVDEKVDGELSRKEVGKETIDGHSCTKYMVTYKSGGKEQQIYQWMASDIIFPVKTSAVDGSWSQEYKNIKTGSQPADIFEVPAGFNKMEIPAGMNMK
ncbi:MAG: DUF4412 domain-containing protein [Nitrospirae bacterium YQR-1]